MNVNDPRRVLVLCTANRCRSQMAEGWLRHFGGRDIEVFSAGTVPQGVHPLAIRVMAEAGVDISSHTSDHVSRYVNDAFDCVVTVCDSARQACPTFPNARRMVHRSFVDPDCTDMTEDELAAVFCRLRDEIRDWANRFIEQELAANKRE